MSFITAIRNFSPGNVKIVTDYDFLPAIKLISIGDNVRPEQVLLIVNATRGTILWDVFNQSQSGNIIGSNIELDIDTSSHSASDRIIIYAAVNEQLQELKEINNKLIELNNKLDKLILDNKIIMT